MNSQENASSALSPIDLKCRNEPAFSSRLERADHECGITGDVARSKDRTCPTRATRCRLSSDNTRPYSRTLRKRYRNPVEFPSSTGPQAKSRTDNGIDPIAHAGHSQPRWRIGKTAHPQRKQGKRQRQLVRFAKHELRPRNRRRSSGKRRQSRQGKRSRISVPIALEDLSNDKDASDRAEQTDNCIQQSHDQPTNKPTARSSSGHQIL